MTNLLFIDRFQTIPVVLICLKCYKCNAEMKKCGSMSHKASPCRSVLKYSPKNCFIIHVNLEEGERSLVLVSRQLDLSGKWLSLLIINCVVLIEERNEEPTTQRERTPPPLLE